MPVVDAGRNGCNVPGSQRFCWLSPHLEDPEARSNHKHLTHVMLVPNRACAGYKRHRGGVGL
jgi:hypothetical protein